MGCYTLSANSIKEPIMTREEYQLIAENLKKRKGLPIFKRMFDILISLVLTIIVSPLLLIISLIIWFDSGGPIFFRQERMGKESKTFRIFKFRTMKNNTATPDGITLAKDNRITKIGGFLRKYRLDELPQLFNIIKGEMSFVGPRPDLPKYYMDDDYGYKCVLLVKPGVTGEATLEFKDEDVILALSENPEKKYKEEIFPKKIKMNIEYIKKISVMSDIRIMAKTFYDVLLKRNAEKREGLHIK